MIKRILCVIKGGHDWEPRGEVRLVTHYEGTIHDGGRSASVGTDSPRRTYKYWTEECSKCKSTQQMSKPLS